MRKLPISTAPKDGSKVSVIWLDDTDRENTSLAQYRSETWLQKAGGDWDENDTGWWTYIDSDTQKRIQPSLWIDEDTSEDGEEN